MKKKRRLEFCHVGIVYDENKSKEEQRKTAAEILAFNLMQGGFVVFDDVKEVGGIKFTTATIYAVKMI